MVPRRLALRRPAAVARVLGAGAVLAALALPASANARVVRAESILPPGESGFVSTAGLGTGTGSPHLYDQVADFVHFDRKNAQLGQAGTVEVPRPGVRILRDRFGVPSIYANDDFNAWWGVGYAGAEDRLVELALFRASTEGQLAGLLGPSYLASDIEARRDYYTHAEVARLFGQLPTSLRRRFDASAAGINAWIAHVRATPADQPAEFAALHISPAPFTPVDLGFIGIQLARTTPNTDGTELDAARALRSLSASAFQRLEPLRVPGQVTTVPPSSGRFPSDPGRTATQERAAFRRSLAFVRGLPLPAPAAASAAAPTARSLPVRLSGSYAIAVSDRRHRHALLFNGPELGFSAPEELWEVEVHRPGLAVRGVTAPGLPVVAIGHNTHVAWGVTSGLSGTNSLYAEQLVPGHPDEYRFRGRIRPMACRNETFQVSAGVGSAAPPSTRGVSICRTVHGPVQARAGNVAYARRYATWMRELPTLTGLASLDAARNIHDVDRAVARVTWNENVIAADDQGNIGFWHPGLLPIRPTGWDERLPYPGTGQAEWRGFLSVQQRPHVIDPRQGYLTNWNTVPSAGWTTQNNPAAERLAGPIFRDALLRRLVRSQLLRRPTFANLQQVIRIAGSTAQQRPLLAARLRRAAAGATGPAATVLSTILRWDGSYDATDAAGKVSPGVAAWQAFKAAAQGLALGRLGPGATALAGAPPIKEHVFDVSWGQAYALNNLSAAGYRTAAAAAFASLSARLGPAPAAWAQPRTDADVSIQGVEKPPPLPFFDRGTFEQLVELRS